MPVTALDSKCALVVIDMQKRIVAMQTTPPATAVADNVVKLLAAFRERALPVVLVHVGWSADSGDAIAARVQSARPVRMLPSDFAEYIDSLEVDPQRDILVLKRQWGAFYGTDLDLQLRRRGVTNIVLCGIATSIGVESTARDAFERSYNPTFASDAMGDGVAEAHERALQIIFPRIGEIGTTAEIIGMLP